MNDQEFIFTEGTAPEDKPAPERTVERAEPGARAAQAAPDLSLGQPVQGIYFIPDPKAAEKNRKWRKRHPKLFWGLIVLLLLVIGNVAAGVYAMLDEDGTFSGPRLGVARLEGVIIDSGKMVNWLELLQKNESVKGVLLYINSGGGGVVPSQEIHAAVKRLSAVKPVVAYMSTAAASGGYYVAVAADHIVASPSTLTGSIGVRMEMANMQKLFETIGIGQQTLSSGPMKEAGTPFRPLRPDEEEYLRGIVMDMYEIFIKEVASGRKMELADVRKLADGRAYTGRQAFELGLVDELGDMATALAMLNQMAGLMPPADEYLTGPPSEKASFLKDLVSGAVKDLVDGLRAGQPEGPLFYY